jgi:hypothetical protein
MTKYKEKHNGYYSLGKNEYYDRLIVPKDVSFFKTIMEADKKVLKVDMPAIFRGIKFGSSPEEAMKIFGEPRYVSENSGISSLVAFYKEEMSNHRVITQLHFMDNEFFYACYTFRNETEVERKAVKKILFEKYSKLNGDTAERYDHLIDTAGNIITVHDSVNFNIVYLWGNEKVKKAVSEHLHALHSHKEREKLKEKADLRSKL